MRPIVLVPYRNRRAHLNQFLPSIRYKLPEADVYVVEQANTAPFNRGWLLNAGFSETENLGDYWISHDVDMIPVNADYTYPSAPTHIATQCSQFRYRMPYAEYFGGVVLFTAQQFKDINGFVNNLRGWGAEDDILYKSFLKKGYVPERRNCMFRSLPHKRSVNSNDYKHNLEILNQERDFSDGLSSCKYEVVKKQIYRNYTHLFIT